MKGLIPFYFLLCLAAAAASAAFIGFPGHFTYDEGVYLLTLKSLRGGAKLYEEIYYTQLPLFIRSLDWFSVGPDVSVSGVRWVIWSMFPVFLGSMGWVGFQLFGPVGGALAMLAAALDPAVFGLSHVVNGNIPAIAWATLAWALALAAGKDRNKKRAYFYIALAALAFATGSQLKALVLPAMIPIALSLINPRRPSFSAGGLTVFSAVFGFASLALLALTGYDFSYISQLQGGAMVSGATQTTPIWDRLTHVWHYVAVVPTGYIGDDASYTYWPLFLVASAAVWGGLITERNRPWLLVSCWWAIAAFALVAHQPVWHHHLLLISPALALGLAGLGNLAISVPLSAKRFGLVFCLVFAISFSIKSTAGPAARVDEMRAEWMRDMHPVVTRIQDKTEKGSYVLSDEPFFIVASGRQAFPSLVDPSKVRIRSGSLTCEHLEKAITDPRTAAVVVEGRFRALDCAEEIEKRVSSVFPVVREYVNEVSVFTRY